MFNKSPTAYFNKLLGFCQLDFGGQLELGTFRDHNMSFTIINFQRFELIVLV